MDIADICVELANILKNATKELCTISSMLYTLLHNTHIIVLYFFISYLHVHYASFTNIISIVVNIWLVYF